MKLQSPNISDVKVFTVEPYFGGMFKVERQRRAEYMTFGHFWIYREGRVGPKKYGLQHIVDQGQLYQKLRILDLQWPKKY